MLSLLLTAVSLFLSSVSEKSLGLVRSMPSCFKIKMRGVAIRMYWYACCSKSYSRGGGSLFRNGEYPPIWEIEVDVNLFQGEVYTAL